MKDLIKKPSEEGFIRGRFGFISVPDFLNLFINRTINHGDIPQHKSWSHNIQSNLIVWTREDQNKQTKCCKDQTWSQEVVGKVFHRCVLLILKFTSEKVKVQKMTTTVINKFRKRNHQNPPTTLIHPHT